MSTDLKDFQPLFGEAKAELEAATPHALLPFLYIIQALDGSKLRVQITDFHSNTWETVKTADQLEQLRDEVGIGGSWHDFLSYLGAAFSSDNVKLILGGPTSSVGGYGATFAKFTAQKSKGMPRVSIYLKKLADPLASDAMGNISVEIFRAFKQKSDALVMAEGHLSQMSVIMASEKEKTEQLQKQLETYGFSNKKRGRKVASSQSIYPPMRDTSLQSEIDATPLQTQTPPETSQPLVLGKPPTVKSKARAAPASRRAKQRGVHLADNDD
ncbi:hypothetical protein SUGI_0002120 [Cryptomeria japonica]|uniref:uncharacterized protein LOC131068204 n=1 Tax=Cryptomeria japonica TaxID=3369 RepID=UPI002408B93B|nr:uncharacterized protein LOC131068204 [Cryptomeria japonica]GLJ04728.1 hypothetical protein SUGI_0002120 [Cryptomeria japonica]